MSIERDDPRMSFIQFDKVADPDGLYVEVFRDRWWVVDPERGVALWRERGMTSLSPQCNASEAITRSLVECLYPWADVRQVPMVLVPIDVRNYA